MCGGGGVNGEGVDGRVEGVAVGGDVVGVGDALHNFRG